MEIRELIRRLQDDAGLRQFEIADILGISQPTISRWVKGAEPRGNHRDALRELAQRHGILGSDESIIGAEGQGYEISIMGRIGAGAEIDAGVEQVPEGGYYDITTVIPLPAGSVGFEVVGDSMWPRYDQGDVIVCLKDGVPLDEIPDGEEAAVRLEDGRRFLKRLLRSTPKGVYNLESHNAGPIRGVHVDWASDVIMIVRANKWKKITDSERRRLAKKAVAERRA